MKRQEKTFFVANLAEELKNASSVILVNYSGLSVKRQQELKKRLREVGAKMAVVKNTLFKLAYEKTKKAPDTFDTPDTLDTHLTGPTALVITEDDPITPLAVLAKFAKEFNILELKVGIVEGSFQDKEVLVKLSKIGSKGVLFGQAVGALSGPINSLTYTLQTKMQNLISVLEKASKK